MKLEMKQQVFGSRNCDHLQIEAKSSEHWCGLTHQSSGVTEPRTYSNHPSVTRCRCSLVRQPQRVTSVWVEVFAVWQQPALSRISNTATSKPIVSAGGEVIFPLCAIAVLRRIGNCGHEKNRARLACPASLGISLDNCGAGYAL